MLGVLKAIAAKCYKEEGACRRAVGVGRLDDSQEARIIQQLRMLGKNIRTSPLSAEVNDTVKNFRPDAIREVLDVLKAVDKDIEAKYIEAVELYDFRGRVAISAAHVACAKKMSQRMNREGTVKPSGKRSNVLAQPFTAGSLGGYSDDDYREGDAEFVAPPAYLKYQKKVRFRWYSAEDGIVHVCF